MEIHIIKQIFENAHSKSEVARILKYPINGVGLRKVTKLINDHKINIDHFDRHWIKKQNIKYPIIQKICPVCGNPFTTQQGHEKEKKTCSYSCSNTFHRTGENNPNYKDGNGKSPNSSYRRICFKYHKKECVVCGENIIVDVHHYDGDHKNNKPENLIPLCPTHHTYWHSKFRLMIKEKIDGYVKNFVNNMVAIV